MYKIYDDPDDKNSEVIGEFDIDFYGYKDSIPEDVIKLMVFGKRREFYYLPTEVVVTQPRFMIPNTASLWKGGRYEVAEVFCDEGDDGHTDYRVYGIVVSKSRNEIKRFITFNRKIKRFITFNRRSVEFII